MKELINKKKNLLRLILSSRPITLSQFNLLQRCVYCFSLRYLNSLYPSQADSNHNSLFYYFYNNKSPGRNYLIYSNIKSLLPYNSNFSDKCIIAKLNQKLQHYSFQKKESNYNYTIAHNIILSGLECQIKVNRVDKLDNGKKLYIFYQNQNDILIEQYYDYFSISDGDSFAFFGKKGLNLVRKANQQLLSIIKEDSTEYLPCNYHQCFFRD